MATDVDDVAHCPIADRCTSCAATTDLGLVTLGTPVGVYCLTVCGACVTAARFPSFGWAATAARVLEHCGHLGIDLDQMADALARERDR